MAPGKVLAQAWGQNHLDTEEEEKEEIPISLLKGGQNIICKVSPPPILCGIYFS